MKILAREGGVPCASRSTNAAGWLPPSTKFSYVASELYLRIKYERTVKFSKKKKKNQLREESSEYCELWK